MKKYKSLFESKKLKYIAYKDITNTRYKSIKPYREYLILTPKSIIEDDEFMRCYNNVQYYTKEDYNSGKISNKMILVDVKNTCIDPKRDKWIFENGEVEVK